MKIQIIALFLALLLALGGLTMALDSLEATPGDTSTNQNNNQNGGSNTTPDDSGNTTPDDSGNTTPDDSDNTGVTFTSWHDFGDCCLTGHGNVYDLTCSSGHTITNEEFDSLWPGHEECNIYDSFYVYCPVDDCGSYVDKHLTHCYENGVCHGCGRECTHYFFSYDYYSYLPSNHPLREKGEAAYPTDTFIFDGVCQFCGKVGLE